MVKLGRSNGAFREILIILVALALTFTLSGCSNLFQAQKEQQPKTTESEQPKTKSDISLLQAPGGTEEAPSKETTKTSDIPQVHKVIKTANVEIEVGKGEFQKRFDQAQAIAEEFDGYVSKTEAGTATGEMVYGVVTLRVPTKKYTEALNRVKKLGKVRKVSGGSEDVSEEYVDLESRLKNYKAQEMALINLMTRSQTVQDTLSVQQSLAQVQEQIEVIQGRLNYLQSRVDFSTINVTIEEPGAVVPPTDEWGFVTALRTAARAFLWVVNALIVIIGALAPIIILVVVFIYVFRYFWKRRGTKNVSLKS